MPKPSQLDVVKSLAECREQRLATEVGELRRQIAGAEATMTQLNQYLAEYQSSDSDTARRSRLPSELENERRFVKRLSAALEQQRHLTQRLAERTSQKVELWQRERANVEALDRVATRREKEVLRKEQRREQRETDAVSTRRRTLPGTTKAQPVEPI